MLRTHIAVILSQMLDAWGEDEVEDVDSFIGFFRDEIMEEIERNYASR